MYLSKGNRKLSKNILIWNLPRLSTCPGAGDCKKWCYEIKIERMYKGTRPCREQNLKDSKRKDFVDNMANYLIHRSERIVRVHEAGDLYSQKYLDKWYLIANLLPDIRFYAYTKSLHLDLWTTKPKNFNILQSFGGKWDSKIDWSKATNRAIKKGDQLYQQEYMCPFTSIRNGGCGETCKVCMNDSNAHVVGFIH